MINSIMAIKKLVGKLVRYANVKPAQVPNNANTIASPIKRTVVVTYYLALAAGSVTKTKIKSEPTSCDEMLTDSAIVIRKI